MKKVISILLCICLIASLAALAGCGNQNQNPAQNQGQSPDPQAGANNTLPDFSDVAKDNEANAGDPVYGGNLRLGFSGGSISNPGYTPINSAAASVPYMRASYESLLVFDEAGNLIPQLCESYEADPEEPSITWTLKQGIKFTDGADFNAEAVKRNIEEYALNNRAEVARIEKCDIIDEYTVRPDMALLNAV